MNERFRDSLPQELVTHVTAGCGLEGEDWLDELPGIIMRLETLWSIKVEEPFPAIEFNYVAPAMLGTEGVVIKIAPPWETVEIYGEAAWLKCRDGDFAVRLMAEDRGSKAILIERAFPGESLTECFAGREPDSVAPAIDVLTKILRPSSDAGTDFVLLDNWFDGLKRHTSKRFPHAYAVKALDIYESLSSQAGKIFYLHGDFHPGNIVNAERVPFLAIDPKGMVGHIGYEIAVFLNNFHWWQDQKPDIRALLDTAVHQFAHAFDISPTELRQWAYAQMVLGAWWMYDEMPEIYDNEVLKADIWDI